MNMTCRPQNSNHDNGASQHRFMQRSLSSSSQNHSVSRPTSVVSLASLDLHMQEPEEQMAMEGHISAMRDLLSGQARNVRLGPIIHLIVFSCLLFATLSDVVLRMNTGNTIAKSSTRFNSGVNKQKSNLGSAMISSITEALSPILPFAGGVDLRRDDKWKSWRNYLWIFREQGQNGTTNLAGHVSLMPRGGAIDKTVGRRRKTDVQNASPSTVMTLSVAVPFLSTKDIADMTLREITFTFRYIIDAGRKDFDMPLFLSQDFEGEPVNDRMEKAVRSIESAVKTSRGPNVLPATTSVHSDTDTSMIENSSGSLSSAGYGDIDALQYCAAMRILAEWRVLRQVPPGYKGYAVGMNLGQKDVVQNVAKIERAAHEWIEARSSQETHCDEDEVCNQRRSPTLRQLLLFEIDINLHPNNKLPRLKEKSCAMGLLWTRRQLHYQTSIFDNIISVPEHFPTVIEAVGTAYTDVYGKLHGWAVQKIFNYSFQSAPNAEEIFRHMNPRRLQQVEAAAKSGTIPPSAISFNDNIITDDQVGEFKVPDLVSIESDDLMISSMVIVEEVPSIESSRNNGVNPFLEFFDNAGKEIDSFGRHVGNEWDKAVCNVSNILKNDNIEEDDCELKHSSFSTRGGGSEEFKQEMSDDEIDEYVTKEMQHDAKDHILTYLKVARPILSELTGLFDEMNMDDPTKV
eukprot:scaffold2621_cov274-Chaetoceros_neogracile.AAC.12